MESPPQRNKFIDALEVKPTVKTSFCLEIKPRYNVVPEGVIETLCIEINITLNERTATEKASLEAVLNYYELRRSI